MTLNALLLSSLVSAAALAQESAPPAPPAAPAPEMTASDAPLAAPETDPGGRVRWGLNAGAGMHFGIPYPIFGMQFRGRIGYQITNLLGAYLDLGGDFGVGGQVSVGAGAGAASAAGLGRFFVQALAELMLADIFYVGAGGGIATGGLGIAGVSVATGGNAGAGISAIAAGGVAPAFDVKLGLTFGKPKPGSFRRGGFSLGIDTQMVLHTNAVVTRVDAGMGGAGVSVNTTEAVFTISPMLTLGYDAR